MPFFSPHPSVSPSLPTAAPQPSAVDAWHQAAEADYRLCRRFADGFDARLPRSGRSARVGWERDGRSVYGILLPDPLPAMQTPGGDWYLYYVWGETLFRRTRKERETLKMLVLPDGTDDWRSCCGRHCAMRCSRCVTRSGRISSTRSATSRWSRPAMSSRCRPAPPRTPPPPRFRSPASARRRTRRPGTPACAG